ncbi:hypothetical protein [Azohydromonas lata]|uniref:hypothetical protein n=1 Tax=Azohydromonas lata TaxID=45677 RepID=UPI00082E5939|nr:hypothetical protein [Azohydromonas lata]
MAAKQLLFRDEVREKIRRGAGALADVVKVTLGPRGRTVILDRAFGAPQIVNSGVVVVARAIELPDRFENMGAQLLREVAARTGETAWTPCVEPVPRCATAQQHCSEPARPQVALQGETYEDGC